MPDPRYKHLYGYKWQQASKGFLRKHPLCAFCERRGRVVLATVVDHKQPHEGDRRLFWDRNNWQPLCKPCHDGEKQKQEKTGRLSGCDQSGIPLDPNHHWNAKG